MNRPDDWRSGPRELRPDVVRPLEHRLAVVTGASRGIGRAVAVDLAQAGAHVIAVARSRAELEELADQLAAEGNLCTPVAFDLRDAPRIQRLAAAVGARWGRLDVLVGNAGMLGPTGPLADLDPDGWDATFALNVGANFRLIRAFDPLLRAAQAARVVFISSSVAHKAEFRPFQGAYAASKAALDAMMRSYAAETAATPIRLMSVNPGALRTRMRAEALPNEDPSSLKTPDALSPRIVDLCVPAFTETGRVYDFPTDSILSFRAPG